MAAYTLVFYSAMVVCAVVAYRGTQMARAFVSKVYRTRAIWIVAVSLALLFTYLVGHAPYVSDLNVGTIPIGFFSIFILLIFLVPFIDSTILVALEMDFFHRNTLRWRRGRILFYILMYGDIAFILVLFYYFSLPSTPAWVNSMTNSTAFNVLFPGILFGSLAYSVVALIASARRTSDIVLRKHLTYIGLLFAFGSISILNDFTVGILVIDGAFGIGGYIPVVSCRVGTYVACPHREGGFWDFRGSPSRGDFPNWQGPAERHLAISLRKSPPGGLSPVAVTHFTGQHNCGRYGHCKNCGSKFDELEISK
jgi:hypothetical protein